MAMTRRGFLQKMLFAGSSVLAAAFVLAKAVSPRRFLMAKPMSKYPGRLKNLENITSQAKWGG
jgi:hypothetical protein